MPHQHLDFTTQIFCEHFSNGLKCCYECNKTAPSWEVVLNQRSDISVPGLRNMQQLPNGPSKLFLGNTWGKIRMHHMCLQISNALAKLLVIFIPTLLALLRMTYINVHLCWKCTYTFKCRWVGQSSTFAILQVLDKELQCHYVPLSY